MDAEQNFIGRKSFSYVPPFENLFFVPLTGDQNLLNHKAALYRSGAVSRFSQKRVGIIGGSGRTGQAAQAAGSTLLPGNISVVRSPVRSGVARALTPGGGRGVRRPRRPKLDINKPYYRCGEGFQFGGRFTDENYSTCGKQLFDIPSLKETLSQALFRTQPKRRQTVATEGRAVLSTVEGEEPPQNMQLMIKRAARVTEVGENNPAARDEGIKQAVAAVSNQNENSGVLVRRDGFAMVPVVSVADLRKIEDNKNMEDAAFVQSVRSADKLGSEELGLLSNTGITSLTYVTPNGVQIRIDRARDLSTGERRQLGKDVNSAEEIDVSEDPLARLNFIVEKTDGGFELSKDFGDIEDPESPSQEKDANGLPVWAYEAFVKAPDPRVEEAGDLDEGDDTVEAVPEQAAEAAGDAGRAAASGAGAATDADAPATDAPDPSEESVAPPEEKIKSVKEAVEHLNKGGLLSAIDPTIILEALEKAENYSSSKPREDIIVYTSDQAGKVIVKTNNLQFQHLGAHFSSELLRELGVQAPAVRFAGEGDDRPFYYRSPDDVIEDANIDPDFEITSVPPERIIATQMADWLSDTRERTLKSLFAATSGEDTDLVVSVGPLAGLAGLTKEELEERRAAVLKDYFEKVNSDYGLTFENADEEQKTLIIEIIEKLIQRAQGFSWQDYFAKLAADGDLSDIERTHLDIVKQIYDSRLDSLKQSKDTLAKIYGVS